MTAPRLVPDDEQTCLAEAAAWMALIAERPLRNGEKDALKTWLTRSPLNAAALDAARQTWLASGRLTAPGGEAMAVRRPPYRLGAQVRWLASGIALVLAMAAAWFAFRTERSYATQPGERTRIVLEDGSQLVLDGDSALAVSMDLLSREIRLEHGRVWVDVAHESLRDFTVAARSLSVTATGTEFIVGPEPTNVSVYLIEGGVDVALAGKGESMRLAPGQKAMLEGTDLAVTRPDRDAELGWRFARLILKDETLAAAVAKLEAYSGFDIALGRPELGELRVTGAFFSEDIEAFLGAVSRIHHLAWRQTGATSYELHVP